MNAGQANLEMNANQDSSSTPTRTIVVGDIHGCYDELAALLSEINFGSNDRLVAVGDLIVKGTKEREVLDLFISDARFSSVIGNQDHAVFQFWRGDEPKLTAAQVKTCIALEPERPRYYQYLASLPLMIDLGSHLVVHAGIRPNASFDEQSPDDLLALRTLGAGKRSSRKGTPWYELYNGDKIVLFGHWPAHEPRVGPRAIGLDTGCVYGHRLTGYVIETGALISVPARFAYRSSGGRFARQLAESALAVTSGQDEPIASD
jgi:serine/threonine protein phosphatase 1